MAYHATSVSFLFFLLQFASQSLIVQGRRSNFFTRVANPSNNHLNSPLSPEPAASAPFVALGPEIGSFAPEPAVSAPFVTLAPEIGSFAPVPAPVPASETDILAPDQPEINMPSPAPTPIEFTRGENAYDLYGQEPDEFFNGNEENEILSQQFSNQNSYKENETPYVNSNNNGYVNYNGGYNNYNEKTQNNNYYNKNSNTYANENSYVNGYQTEKQGMSATRFLDNGRYSYNNANGRSSYNGYGTNKESTNTEGSYGNNVNSNEYNTMEESQENQGEYEDEP